MHELQEALVELLHATFTAAWTGDEPPSSEEILRQFKASARVTMLTQRVRDDGVRSAVDIAAARFDDVNSSQEPTMDMARIAAKAQDHAQGVIGAAVRSIL